MSRGLQRFVAVLALWVAPAVVATPAAGQRLPRPFEYNARREALFVAAITASAAANSVLHYHHAAGTPPPGSDADDRWLGRDKALHASASYALTLAGMGAGARPWVAAVGTCAAGAVFEVTQARVSGKDAVTNCAAAGLAWGTSWLWRRGHARGAPGSTSVAARGG